jgi:DNA modification methylase
MACKQLNRKFIGIEKEKMYCDIAESRISSVPKHLQDFEVKE